MLIFQFPIIERASRKFFVATVEKPFMVKVTLSILSRSKSFDATNIFIINSPLLVI